MKIVIPKYDSEISKLLKTDSNVILDFYANWCGPCKVVSKAFDEVKKENIFKNITLIKINIEKFDKLAGVYNIKSLPTVVFTSDVTGERKNLKTKVGTITKVALIELIGEVYDK